MDNVDSDQTVWMDALADISLQWMGISEDMFFSGCSSYVFKTWDTEMSVV